MDKYTKFILTMIAVGILGLNYHLFKGGIISEVQAASHKPMPYKIAICNSEGSVCAKVGKSSGGLIIYDQSSN